jgi:hypothetical protein
METIYRQEKVLYYTELFKNYNKFPIETKSKPDNDFDIEYYVNFKKGFTYDMGNETEECFVKNYSNPFASISMLRKTFVVEKNEDKISMKLFSYRRSRGLEKKYFKVRREVSFLTFSFKTKMFYSGSANFKKKIKIGGRFRVNRTNLVSLEVFNNLTKTFIDDDVKKDVFNNFFDEIIKRLNLQLQVDTDIIPSKYYQIILLNNKIKFPDSYFKFAGFYLTKKILKKFDSNLVTWFMKTHEVKGTKIRRLLNQYDFLDLSNIKFYYDLLGVDLFNKIKDEVFLTTTISDLLTGLNYSNPIILSKKEKENIVSVLNTTTTSELTFSLLDHFQFKKDLEKYGEFVKINVKTYDEFVVEHFEWSSLLQSYKTGVVDRFYGDEAYLVEKPIKYNDETFYPVLLKTTEQYENESMTQSNCVRTYSEKPHCFIVSLRKGDKNSNIRATIEFQFRKKELLRIQTLGRFNKLLSEEWNSPVDELTNFANYLYQKEFIKLPQMTKKYMNGKVNKLQSSFFEVETEEGVVHRMTPSWSEQNTLQENLVDYHFFDELF